jgi:hypothetical protein
VEGKLGNGDWGIEIPGGYFDEGRHLYRNSKGTVVPSVTQVFTLLGFSDYTMIKPSTLEWKRLYGSAVHSALEYLIDGDLDWDELDEKIIAPVAGIEQWLKNNKYVSEAVEEAKIVSIFGMEFGMRLDHRGRMEYRGKERSVILDLKTASKEEPVWKWQLGAYSLGQDKVASGWLGAMLKVDEAGEVKPFYYDLVAAAREFQTLLATVILGVNNGIYRIGSNGVTV